MQSQRFKLASGRDNGLCRLQCGEQQQVASPAIMIVRRAQLGVEKRVGWFRTKYGEAQKHLPISYLPQTDMTRACPHRPERGFGGPVPGHRWKAQLAAVG
jgi:hypothetical protein